MDDNQPDNGSQHVHNQLQRKGPERTVASILGWPLLILMLVLMFSTQLNAYLHRPSANKAEADWNVIDRQVKTALSLESLIPSTGAISADMPDPMGDTLTPLTSPRAYRYKAAWALYKGRTPGKDLITELEQADPKFATVVKEGVQGGSAFLTDANKLSYPDLSDDLLRVAARLKAGEKSPYQGVVDPIQAQATLILIEGMALACITGIGVWIGFGFYRSRVPEPLAHPLEQTSEFTSSDLAFRAGLGLLCLQGAGFLIGAGLSVLLNGVALSLVATFVTYIVSVAVMLARIDGKQLTLRHLGFPKTHVWKHVIFGVLGFVASIPVTLVLTLLISRFAANMPEAKHPEAVKLLDNPSPLMILWFFVAAAVFAPIFEEIAFRGAFLRAVDSKLGRLAASLIVNFAFASIHPTGVPAWPVLMGIGLVSTLLVYETKSLLPSIVFHAIHNTATMVGLLAFGG